MCVKERETQSEKLRKGERERWRDCKRERKRDCERERKRERDCVHCDAFGQLNVFLSLICSVFSIVPYLHVGAAAVFNSHACCMLIFA